MNTAGIRLAQLRNEKKMSQRELAEKMDVSQSYVGQWKAEKESYRQKSCWI